jgi:hypothetical protein
VQNGLQNLASHYQGDDLYPAVAKPQIRILLDQVCSSENHRKDIQVVDLGAEESHDLHGS